MQIKAKLNYLRIAPRKVRLVADLIRRKRVGEAQEILSFTVKKSTRPISKLLSSAVSSAKNNFQIEPENLYISKITVDEGPKIKRWMPRSRGQAAQIQKKTSHITLILDEVKPSKRTKSLKKKTALKPEKEPEIKKEEVKKEVYEPKKEKQRPEIKARKPKIMGAINKMFRRKSF